MNKIVSRKRTSAIFLAIVLVLGTIAFTAPSFMTNALATSDRERDYDNDEDKKSYDKDSHDSKYSSYKDDYKSEYSSYGKDDRDYDKSKKDSSSSVSIKKVKCNNINVNLNGINANIGLPFNDDPVSGPIAVAQEAEYDEESNSIESSDEESDEGRDRQSDSNTNSRIVCINNNNNTVIEAEEPIPPTPPEPLTCEECFEEFLSQDEIDLFGELFGSTIDRFCILFTNPENEIVVPEDAFRMALPGVDSEDIDNLIDCLEEQGVVFIQDTPPI